MLTEIILIHTSIRILLPNICIRVRVIISYHIVDFYINTIYDMQNEKDFFNPYNQFEYIQDFVKFF